MEERDWKGGRGQMRNRKKALTRKGKIMAALAVVITFVFVLAWHQMRNAQAYGTYDTGGNKHFVDGHLTVTINGPDGKSDSLTMYVHSDDYEKNKNVSGATFKKSKQPICPTRKIELVGVNPQTP